MPATDKRSLHSRYNPEGEAERFVDALNLNKDIRFFLLIEPGLGYIIPPLRKKNPFARIISLHASGSYSDEAALPCENQADASWYQDSTFSLQAFLEKEIPDIGAGSIKIIEWRPGMVLYGEAYLKVLAEAAEFIKRADANFRTAISFGRRWFRNFFRNLSIINECASPCESDLPVVVTGAGPSLETLIPILREQKNRADFFILAVSSSAAALNAGGVEPDLVLSTDGGNWALLHLVEYYRPWGGRQSDRSFAPEKHFLAATMNAALPSQSGQSPVLVSSDGSLWQNLILKGLGIPFVSMPQRGTVSASAIDLAFCLSRGNVFLCGADLAHNDMLTHARPYSFDRLWEEKQSRLNPFYSQIFCRSSAIRGGGSLGIYASWFSRQIERYPKRLFSLGANNSVFGNLAVSSLPFDSEKKHPRPAFNILPLNLKVKPGPAGVGLLIEAMENPGFTGKLTEELGPLLCPGEAHVSAKHLKDEILSLTEPYRKLP
ncbi:MAG: DUF115 domain-containing protein [Treponema sp.]|jgi:hypothetical protein|nr:DUF115 domain-containing protein [Treponema sp.]